jgi:hypothetical protein
LALSKKVAGVSGKYFRFNFKKIFFLKFYSFLFFKIFSDCKESKKVHPLVSDPLACEILYNNSLEQCELDRSNIALD